MKKLQKGIGIFLCVLMVMASLALPVKATNKTNRIKKLVKQMETYEFETLIAFKYPNSKLSKKNVMLTDTRKAEAAALSIPKLQILKKIEYPYGEEILYKLTKKKLSKASMDIFGKAISISKLRKNPKEEAKGFYDAYRTGKGIPVVHICYMDTHNDYKLLKTSISRQKNGKYKVTKTIFCDYFGRDHKKPNFKVIYTVVPNKKSKYGYVIKSMSLQKIKS